jgi:inner membrane protein
MENMNLKTNNESFTISLKLLLIAGITLGLLIPSSMILLLIKEREQRQKETIAEVDSKWANSQTLCGPVVTIPYKKRIKENDKTVETLEYAHFVPKDLSIKGEIVPKSRYRGIYKVILYKTILHFDGEFDTFDFSSWGIPNEDIMWNEAFISLGLSDLRGVNTKIPFWWNKIEYPTEPGTKMTAILESGINATVPVKGITGKNTFSCTIDLNGSESLQFIPLGNETNVALKSVWSTPSFQGSFLPKEPEISDKGFTAVWKILELNLNYPGKWLNNEYQFNVSPVVSRNNQIKTNSLAFGVSLLQPVDIYQMSERSVKYAILFLALTFLVIFFAEMLLKNRVHVMQYILIGIALCIFYSLLLALSEHMKFLTAYSISAAVIIGLIAAFIKSVFNSNRMAFIMILILGILYTFLFILLILEDYSMLLGNIGLVLILGMVMWISRKIDWFGVKKLTEPIPDPPAIK